MIGNSTQASSTSEGSYSHAEDHATTPMRLTVRTPSGDPTSPGQVNYIFIESTKSSATPIQITGNFIVPTGVQYGVYNVQATGGLISSPAGQSSPATRTC
jgi:hypothetical protein